MLKATAQWCNRVLWTVIVTVLVLSAIYVSIGRYYIDYVEDYQQELVNRFIDNTGLAVSVGRFYGEWDKLSPILTLENFSLPASDPSAAPVLTISEVSFQLDPIDTVLKRQLQIKRLIIDGVELTLQQTTEGWRLQEMEFANNQAQAGDVELDSLLDMLLAVETASLNRANVYMRYADGESSVLLLEELSLKHDAGFRRSKLQATIDDSEHPMFAIIESKGDPRDQATFSARAYFKLDEVDFAPKLPILKAFGIDLQEAEIDGELWLDWRPNTRVIAQGYLSTPSLDLSALSDDELAPVTDFRIGVYGEKSPQGWQLWLPELDFSYVGKTFSFQRWMLSTTPKAVTLSVPEIDLATAAGFLLELDTGLEEVQAIVQDLSPEGRLRNIRLELPQAGNSSVSNQIADFSLRANLDDITVQPWHGAPGATGVRGFLTATASSGQVSLAAENMTLSFPTVYHHALEFSSAKGQVSWIVSDQRVRVDSSPLLMETDHGPVTGVLDLDLGLQEDAEKPPSMDLMIGLKDVPAIYRERYIPYILNEDFRQWMSDSVPEGQIIEGGFIYRGSLRSDDSENRTVQLFFDVADVVLDYHQDWPPIHNIDGLVRIDDGKVAVSTRTASLFDLSINSLEVNADSAAEGGMWLTVDGKLVGPADDALKVVNQSAIDRMVNGTFQSWRLKGAVDGNVQLGIPLAGSEREPDVDVRVNLASAELWLPEQRLQLTAIKGPLNYNSKSGISSSGLAAQLYDRELAVLINEVLGEKVTVDLAGKVDIRDVENWSQQAALSFAEGVSEVEAQIVVRHGEDSELIVNSDLAGLAIKLPEPYGKSADSKRDFTLRMPLGGETSLLTMGLAQQAELQLQFQSDALESGLIVLGEETELSHESGKLVLAGEIQAFDFEQWSPVLDSYREADDYWRKQQAVQDDAATDEETDEETGEKSEAELQLKLREFDVHAFLGFGQRYENSVVNALREADHWWLSAKNTELSGSLIIPDDNTLPLTAALDYFRLPALQQADPDIVETENLPPEVQEQSDVLAQAVIQEQAVESEQAVVAEPGLQLADISDLNIILDIDQLYVGDELWGDLAFSLSKNDERLLATNITGKLRGMQLPPEQPASLEWRQHGDQQHEGQQQTSVKARLQMDDIGNVLRAWQYERIIESQKGEIEVDFSWPGGPDQWSLASTEGALSLNFKEGRFLKASDTASGALKVVGIVNLTNIIKRLQLDFSDISNKGISYDRIKGNTLFSQGRLSIEEEVEVSSPSSRFSLRGDADLMAETLDMTMVVTLPVASNLPWLAALAGGLPTAAGVYVASKLFEEQVNRFSSAVYQVKGDWNNPELKFNRVFDDTKSVKKKDKPTSKNGTENGIEKTNSDPVIEAENGGEEHSSSHSDGKQ